MRRPGIRTVLLSMSLLILALPIGGFMVLRIYESALVRQTETGLITQSALIAAQYRATLLRLGPATVSHDSYGVFSDHAPIENDAQRWRPRQAAIDLATKEVLPELTETSVNGVADEMARRAGEEIEPVLRQAQLTTLAGLRVTDYSGVVVATTGDDHGHFLGQTEELKAALAGKPRSTLRDRTLDGPAPPYSSISRGSSLRVYVSTPVFIGSRVVGAVQAVRTPRTLGASLYANRKLLTAAGLGLLALTALAGLLVSYAIVRPIKQLRVQALRAVAGEPGAMTPLAQPVTRDVEHLSTAVSTMAQTLEQRADYMREFASHVSHEFKTPLTSIKGGTEILQDHLETMTVQEQAHFISNIASDTERLQRLVDDLLSLTTARYADSNGATGLISECFDELSLVERAHKLTLCDTADFTHLRVGMPGPTLASVLNSVVDNAFEHGATEAALSLNLDNDYICIHCTDNGPGIDPSLQDRIFEPLFTTKTGAGSGLGLALVASLVRSHAGSVRAIPSATGAHIEIRLPAHAA